MLGMGILRDWLLRRSIERRRAIFRYFDGRRVRRVDPLVVLRKLEEHAEFDPETTPAFAADGDSAAVAVMADAARFAFGIEPLGADQNGAGLTEQELIGVLVAFCDYTDELQKKSGWTPTLPRPTASESSPNGTAGSTTKPESACCSTHAEPTSAKPEGSARC